MVDLPHFVNNLVHFAGERPQGVGERQVCLIITRARDTTEKNNLKEVRERWSRGQKLVSLCEILVTKRKFAYFMLKSSKHSQQNVGFCFF